MNKYRTTYRESQVIKFANANFFFTGNLFLFMGKRYFRIKSPKLNRSLGDLREMILESLSNDAKSIYVITISRIAAFSNGIATVAFNSVDIAVSNLSDDSDMIWLPVGFPVKEDYHARIDDLVIVGTIDFRAIYPLIMGLEPGDTI